MTTHLNQTTSTTPSSANSNHHNQSHQQQHHHQQYHHHHHVNANSAQMLECKSKYDAEFRRFGLNRYSVARFEDFYAFLERLHGLSGIAFNIYYTDKDGELLPINNDNNLAHVLQVTVGVLRLIIFRRGECYPEQTGALHSSNHGYPVQSVPAGTGGVNLGLNYSSINSVNSSATPSYRATNIINHIKELSTTLTSSSHHHQPSPKPFSISYPADFRPVSAIIDVDILPETYRRVRLHKHKSSKPLGFYIRDGRSLRVTPNGVEQVPGIFISRLMPGGLAESTGLLSVNDEVIEVNGIEVSGKTLDQVTDMMVANSSNLIITVKPTNQKYNLNRSGAAAILMNRNTPSSTPNQMNMSASGANPRNSMKQQHHHHAANKAGSSSSSADVSKLSAKSNDAATTTAAVTNAIATVTAAVANTSSTNNGSSITSSSSVNSSFSSSNQPVNRRSFKAMTNGTSTKAPAPLKPPLTVATNQIVDNDQVKLDVAAKKPSALPPAREQQPNSEDEVDEADTDDDDDDDEEIHDATNQNHHHYHQRSSDDDNNDDKILTL